MNTTKVILLTVLIVGFLMVVSVWGYYLARADEGVIVLPAGSTYLGPTP